MIVIVCEKSRKKKNSLRILWVQFQKFTIQKIVPLVIQPARNFDEITWANLQIWIGQVEDKQLFVVDNVAGINIVDQLYWIGARQYWCAQIVYQIVQIVGDLTCGFLSCIIKNICCWCGNKRQQTVYVKRFLVGT